MSDLTAADLTRLDHLTEYATAGPWEPWYSDLNECWEVGRCGPLRETDPLAGSNPAPVRHLTYPQAGV